MKICFLLGGLTGNGGIGRVTSVLTNKLVNKYDVDVFVVSYADTHKPQLYELDSRIHTHMLFNNPISMKKAVLCNIVGKLKKYLNENKIDVLIACGSLFFPVAVRACRRIATKCVCWDHTAPHVTTDHAFQAWSRKYGAKHSDINALITLSAKRFYDENFCDSQKNILIYGGNHQKKV